MTTTITEIISLPTGPFQGTGTVGIVITPNVPSFFKVVGTELQNIVSVNWYPENPASVMFETRGLVLVDNTTGTFMFKVIDNYLSDSNRAGRVSFTLNDGTTIAFPVKTYGPVSYQPLWQSPYNGLNTG